MQDSNTVAQTLQNAGFTYDPAIWSFGNFLCNSCKSFFESMYFVNVPGFPDNLECYHCGATNCSVRHSFSERMVFDGTND